MKKLSLQTGDEVRFNVDYIICRFMKSKKAYKTPQNPKDVWFTMKPVKEKNVPEEIQIHLRFNGRDYWYNEEDIIDIDVYVNKEEFLRKVDVI